MIPNGSELIIILAIVALLFGANRLPMLARAVGQTVTEFKQAVTPRDPADRGKTAK
ncbi:MAG: twin-arginine translocase TatA/TatE family subunit [Candidatus Hydrogenedentes bacterium]|nr:twin-arginine translocase TatA/TatE family subunit [Candidatus Hydrogenedentota bacterium]